MNYHMKSYIERESLRLISIKIMSSVHHIASYLEGFFEEGVFTKMFLVNISMVKFSQINGNQFMKFMKISPSKIPLYSF